MATHSYENFDLQITGSGQGYIANVIASPVGEATTSFTLDFTPDELRNFFWLSGRTLRQLRPLAQGGPSTLLAAQQFGQRLYDAVFAGPVRTQLRRSLDAVSGRGNGLRIRLRLSAVPELAELPWEYLYATDLNRALATATATPIVRYLDLAEPEQPLAMRPPLRILGVVAAPRDAEPLKVEQEWRQLHDALADLASRQLLTLERLPHPTLPALQERLRDAAVHVLHFIGHGDFDKETNTGLLLFEDDAGKSHPVSAEQLATILHDRKTLRLAFLNACQGAQGARTDPFGGVAQKLVQQGVPSVLAMQFPVSDRAAITLAHEFYRALADGYPVDAATGEARQQLYVAGNDREWGTPVLFTRSSDNRILELPSGDFRPLIQRQDWEPETVLIPGGPFLMGSDRDTPHEAPQHEVMLPDFRMGKYPVTVREFAHFVKETKAVEWAREASWSDLKPPPQAKLDHPVTGVSWFDALAYCEWLSTETKRRYRLPSEAEWEKAASWGAGDRVTERQADRMKRRYPWGDEWADGRCNAVGSGTTAVAAHPTGASAYGVEDLLGNVQEWTCSLWGSQPQQPDYRYRYVPGNNREVLRADDLPTQMRVVHRGGSYNSQPADLRCTARGNALPNSRVAWRGFRVVMMI